MNHIAKFIKTPATLTPKYLAQYTAFSFGIGVIGGLFAFVPAAVL